MAVYLNDWKREQVGSVTYLFYEPVDETNNQAKQHETPQIDKYIGNSLGLAFAVTKHPIKTHNYEPNAESSYKYFKTNADFLHQRSTRKN